MSKLEELIQQYCPDGVEWKHLEEFCEIKTGKGITKKDSDENGTYPIISGGVTPMGYYHIFNREGKTVTISRVGANAGLVSFIDKRFYLNDKCFSIIPSNGMNTKFLYYILSARESDIKGMQSEGGVPTINTQKVGSIEIPVPPLPVQEEIVRILDTFTELQAELQAELQKRKQQYNYYLDNLLNFNDINRGGQAEVRWMKLKDIGKVCMCKRILKSQTSSSGDVPFFKIGTFGDNADAYISQALFNEYKAKYSYPQKGDVLISAAGTIGKTIVFDGTPSYFQDSNIVWLKHDESIVLNSYLRYCYTLNPWVVSTGGTIARLYNDNILEATIPVPSLAEQQRIVSILDRFDRLTNDLTAGLPAEIEKRKQQYEYYRDKLLTFKRKGA